MVSRTHFAFDATWRVAAPPGDLFAALAAVEDYPRWWPQVVGVQRLSDEHGIATIRSRLPVSLRLVLSRAVQDEARGVLRVDIAGDLVGFAAFTVVPEDGGGARADYRQEVRVAARHLRLGALLAPRLLRANHEHMMRAGETGLQRLLG